MRKGSWYGLRLGKPLPLTGLRSEWFDLFLRDVEGYGVKEDSISLWALGGAGFILRTVKSTVYIDPYLGGTNISRNLETHTEYVLHRMIPIPFNASDITKIDAAVMTHEDPDHMNEDFIFPMNRNSRCLFIGPPSVAEILESWKIQKNRIVALRPYEEERVNDLRIIGLPSADPGPKTANTYLFDTGKIRMFHSGDSPFSEEFAEIGNKYDIDIAAINLGISPPGCKWYNNPGDVVRIADELGAKIVIPMHWDIWSLCVEDPKLVEEEVKFRKRSMRVVVLRIGQRFDYGGEVGNGAMAHEG